MGDVIQLFPEDDTKEESYRLALESIQRWTTMTTLPNEVILYSIAKVVASALREG